MLTLHWVLWLGKIGSNLPINSLTPSVCGFFNADAPLCKVSFLGTLENLQAENAWVCQLHGWTET